MLKSATRIARVFLVVSAAILLLLWFPEHLPWAAGFLLATGLVLWLRGKGVTAASTALYACLLPVIKNVGYSIGVLAFIGLTLIVGSVVLLAARHSGRSIDDSEKKLPRRAQFGIAILFLAPLIPLFVDWETTANPQKPIQLTQKQSIVCLGDSLTAAGYPEELRRLVNCEVIDLGRDGITSVDALVLLNAGDLYQHPQLVVLAIGGHDYNQCRPRQETLKTMRSLVEYVRDELQARVVIVEIPRGFVFDPYQGIERQLAREYDLTLVSDSTIRWFVLRSPIMPPGSWLPKSLHFSRDGLHPNQNGNRAFAKIIADRIRVNATDIDGVFN